MKKILYTLLLCLPAAAFAQVGMGTTTPDASAQLDVSSTTKGVLFPRLTTTQRDAMTSPATGLVIFNITDSTIQVNTGTTTAPVWGVANGGGLSNIALTSSTTPAGKTAGQMTFNTNAASGLPVGPVYWDGTKWVSANGSNIYTADGTLTGDRVVSVGANSLSFTGTGNFGLGASASPLATLHIHDNGTLIPSSALLLTQNNKPGSMFYTVSSIAAGAHNSLVGLGDSKLIFSTDGIGETDADNGLVIGPFTGGASGIKIMENGNVGIGEAQPNSTLNVGGAVSFKTAVLPSGFLGVYNVDNSASYIIDYGPNIIAFPAATASLSGRMYKIKVVNNTITFTGSFQKVDGSSVTDPSITPGVYEIHCVSDGGSGFLWAFF